MARLTGTWTVPGKPLPSSHLLTVGRRPGTRHENHVCTRCGICELLDGSDFGETTPEPPARGRTCESCLRYSRRDG